FTITLSLSSTLFPYTTLFRSFVVVHPFDAHADDTLDMKAALDTRLAYVVTGISEVDDMSGAGLYGLGLALKARTSYEPQDPVGVDRKSTRLNSSHVAISYAVF